jgi:hypothetical protein
VTRDCRIDRNSTVDDDSEVDGDDDGQINYEGELVIFSRSTNATITYIFVPPTLSRCDIFCRRQEIMLTISLCR